MLTFSAQNAYKFREDILNALKNFYGVALSRVLHTLWKVAARQPYNSIHADVANGGKIFENLRYYKEVTWWLLQVRETNYYIWLQLYLGRVA